MISGYQNASQGRQTDSNRTEQQLHPSTVDMAENISHALDATDAYLWK